MFTLVSLAFLLSPMDYYRGRPIWTSHIWVFVIPKGTHSSTLAWKILWMEEPGGPQSMGSLRVGHDWVTSLSLKEPQIQRPLIFYRFSKLPNLLHRESLSLNSWWGKKKICLWLGARAVSSFQRYLHFKHNWQNLSVSWDSQVALVVKNPPSNARCLRDMGLIPGWGRSPGGGHGNPLQCSCLENPMDGGAWGATVHGVAESDTIEVT